MTRSGTCVTVSRWPPRRAPEPPHSPFAGDPRGVPGRSMFSAKVRGFSVERAVRF